MALFEMEGMYGMSTAKPRLKILRDRVSVFRMPADSPVPMTVFESDYFSITKTPDELSIVCDDSFIPVEVKRESDFRVIKVDAGLELSMVGIIAGISGILADNGISVFVISAYDTVYIIVRARDMDNAVSALMHTGYDVKRT